MLQKISIVSMIYLFWGLEGGHDVWANEPAPKQKETEQEKSLPKAITYTNLVGYLRNPIGVGTQLKVGYRQKMFQKPPDDLLFGTSHFHTGVNIGANPAFSTYGVFFKVQPIALLILNASIDYVVPFNGGVPDDDFYAHGLINNATKASAAIPEQVLNSGLITSLSALLQFKAGSIAIRNEIQMAKFNIQPTQNDRGYDLTYFYYQNFDVVSKIDGIAINNNADVLYADDTKPWILGLRHTYTNPFSPHPDFALFNMKPSHHRLGPVLVWKLNTRSEKSHFTDHTFVVLSQWYLQHPFRTGSGGENPEFNVLQNPFSYSTSQAEPCVWVIYSFGGTHKL